MLENLTAYFQRHRNKRVVLDRTKVAIERPRVLASRLVTTLSTYAVKVLIGYAPSGMVTVVGTG